MDAFSAEWLALREPADHAARAGHLVTRIAERMRGQAGARAVDLAAGTGSNVRYLLPRLQAVQHWTLVDHDAALLAEAWRLLTPLAARAGRTFDVRAGDLRDLDALPLAGAALVTASALLDLVSEEWLRGFAARCREARVDVLCPLVYDGRLACTPADPADELIRSLVNLHQRSDKGFGPALGPEAVRAVPTCFDGFELVTAESDWTLGPESGELQRQLVEGWAHAAREISASDAREVEAWRARRLSSITSGTSHLRVGHRDILGLSPKLDPAR